MNVPGPRPPPRQLPAVGHSLLEPLTNFVLVLTTPGSAISVILRRLYLHPNKMRLVSDRYS